mmetsp:Transcript_15841/g.36940  ORF Transcript_15841/g.36940 Transcript_15841/m.36940 type:complete len:491 (+) Transcript_15841:793-2265(+)
MDVAHFFKDTESVALAWGTDGLWFTTAEAINTTSSAGDAPWDVTRHTYLQSVSPPRLALTVAYVFVDYRRAITKPDECSILRNSVLRTVYEAIADSTRAPAGTLDQAVPGQGRVVGQIVGQGAQVAEADAEVGMEQLPTQGAVEAAITGDDGNIGLAGTPATVGEHDDGRTASAFSESKLEEASEKSIEALGEDEDVVALMPAEEFVIANGPKRTVLYWLSQNVTMTKKINGSLEGVKALSANINFLTGVLAILAMTEVVPYELVWLVVAWIPDILRKLFKMNVEAIGLILRELDFWVPFVTTCIAAYFYSASFAHEAVFSIFIVLFTMWFIVNVLFADADLSRRVIRSTSSSAPKYVLMLLAVSTVCFLMTFGLCPRAENHAYSYHFAYNEGTVETVSMFTRFICTPLLFLCKFIVKSLVYKGRTVIIKMPLVRHVMPKRELHDFLRRRGEVSRQNSSSSTTPGPASSLSRTSESPTPASPELGPRAAA